MDVMEVHTNLPLVELLMHRVCHRAVIRLAALPVSHPLHKPVHICARRRAKQHLSPIYLLLHAYSVDPSKYETIAPASRPPNRKHNMVTNIALSREESKEDNDDNKATLKVYMDGSGQEGKAGTAAVLFKGKTLLGKLRCHLGSLEQYTTYEAELVGILLGLWLIRREPDTDSASLKADSQVAIQALNTHTPRPGGHLLNEIHELSDSLYARSISDLQLKISWISGHDGVAGNKRVDEEAKAAAKGNSSPWHELPPLLQSDPLPLSTTAAKQHFQAKLAKDWRGLWAKSPHYQHSSKINLKLPATSFLKLTREVSKLQASTIFQLRSKHMPLRKYLHRIGKADSPLYELCGRREETIHHFLFDCTACQVQAGVQARPII